MTDTAAVLSACAHHTGQGGTLHGQGEWLNVYTCVVCERSFNDDGQRIAFDHSGPYVVAAVEEK